MKPRSRTHHRPTLLGVFVAVLALGMSEVAGAQDLRNADRALSEGRLEAALQAYEQASKGGNPAGDVGVGRVWLLRNQYGKAMEAFRRAAERDPRLASASYGQAEVWRYQGKCAEAIPLYEQAVSLDRKFPEAQLGLGACLVAVGQIDRAMTVLNKGLDWGKQWAPRFLVARARAHIARNALREAGVDLTRAREAAPRDPVVRKAIGEYYLERGTWALAVPEFEAAIALDPNDIEAQYLLAQALYYNQEYEKALQAYRKVTAQDSNYAPALLGLGNLLYLAGAADPRRYLESRELLEKFTRMEPEDPKGWSLLGRTYYHLGMRDEAQAALERAERLGAGSKEMYTIMGRVHADMKQWDKALEALNKGEKGPKELALIAQIYELSGRPELADSLYRTLSEADSTSAVALHQHAKLRYRQKDYGGARALFDRVVALEPGTGEAWFYRGLAMKELGDTEAAVASLEKAAEIDSARADRWFWLGVLYDARKRTADAERAFRRVIELEPKETLAGKAHRQLGYYLLLRKQWKDAIHHLERATDLDSGDAQGWLWLAQGHQNAGNRTKAAQGYRRVLKLDPNNAQAKKGLQSLSAVSRRG